MVLCGLITKLDKYELKIGEGNYKKKRWGEGKLKLK
jgi:hypothetical protein